MVLANLKSFHVLGDLGLDVGNDRSVQLATSFLAASSA